MTMRIEVTAEDIARGEPRNECWCPVARAITRAADLPAIVHDDVWCVYDSMEGPYALPEEATTFIARFDKGAPVQPFAFEIEEPEGSR